MSKGKVEKSLFSDGVDRNMEVLLVPNESSFIHYNNIWWLLNNGCLENDKDVLLVAEKNIAKRFLSSIFPCHFTTAGFGYNVDISWDLVSPLVTSRRYDAILNQATLEHLCFPFLAIKHMSQLLKSGGLLSIHTHKPIYPIHGGEKYSDCLRFLPGFWTEIIKYISCLELIELDDSKNGHWHVLYRRV